MSIADNIARIQERMAAAAHRAGRQAGEIALMAVSKTMTAACIREAFSAGQRLFGENRVQEFQAKHAELNGLSPIEFHLIGHLQSNKATKAVELFQAVESVDLLRLAERLEAAAANLGKTLPVWLEVNIGGEEAKSGLGPDSAELTQILEAAPRLPNLRFRGLMTVPPFTENPEGARPYFRQLRQLRDRLTAQTGVHLPELSMGMSHDFEVAIEEGSTCVRVGTAIFGARKP